MLKSLMTVRCLMGIGILFRLWMPGWSGLPSVQYVLKGFHGTPAHVVIADLRDDRLLVTPKIAYGEPGRLQSFTSFDATYHPLAQITGSFFNTKNAYPIGDVVMNNHWYIWGSIGSALVIDGDNTASIMEVPGKQQSDWGGYESVLRGGIRLLENGKMCLSPYDQGFHEGAIYNPAVRTAIGLQSSKDLLLVAVPKKIYLSELVDIMKALGCQDAMALDGGSSTGLAYNGNIVIAPARSLATVLAVVERTHPVHRPHVRKHA